MNTKNREKTKTIFLPLLVIVTIGIGILYGDLVIGTCLAIVLGEAVAIAC